MKRIYILFFAVAVLFIGAATAKLFPQIVIVSGDQTVYTAKEQPFSIEFVHSVNRTPVTEYYEVQDGQLMVTACRYYAFGAGVASLPEDGGTIEILSDGSMLLTGLNRRLPQLNIRLSDVTQHFLHIDGSTITLSQLAPNHQLKILVTKLTFIQLIFGGTL